MVSIVLKLEKTIRILILGLLIFYPSVDMVAQVEYKSIKIGSETIHYKIMGKGIPIILLHGSLADLRYWEPLLTDLSKEYQVITYSRRYNYPNTNDISGDHSALVEANDLLKIMDALKISQAHILGHSYGGYTALVFALNHSERIKKLILAEPPLMRWLPEIPGGEGIMEEFIEGVWIPLATEFNISDEAGLEFTSQWYYSTSLNNISAENQSYLKDNVLEWKALALSSDAYPYIDPLKVKNLKLPVLLLSGDKNKGSFFDLIEGRLTELIPDTKRVFIPNSGHEMFTDNPIDSNAAIINFIRD